MEIVPVAKAQDIAEGAMIAVMVAGSPVLISRIGGKYYAMDAVCSHYFGYLPRGQLRANAVICPVHGARFNVTNGKVEKNVWRLVKLATRRGATDLRTYDVKVLGDEIGLMLPQGR